MLRRAIAGTGQRGNTGAGKIAILAQLFYPYEVAVSAAGDVYVADNRVIRRVSASPGIITTVAGSRGTFGYTGDGGPATAAAFYFPQAITLNASGNLYIADTYNYAVRVVSATTGIISTIAGNGQYGYSGDGGSALSATLQGPVALALDGKGNMFIANGYGGAVRKLNLSTGIITTAVAVPDASALSFDSNGNLWIANASSSVLQELKVGTSPTITVAGTGVKGYIGDGGSALLARIRYPRGVAAGPGGAVYIADSGNSRVRAVSAAGIVTTAFGNGLTQPAMNNVAETTVPATPSQVLTDSSGNLYYSDDAQSSVLKVSPNGILTTFAGNGMNGYAGDGGPAINAELSQPNGLAVHASGNLYVADAGNNVVRKVNVATGAISTFAGNGSYDTSGDGDPAIAASFSHLSALALDASGNLYISDEFTCTIRKVTTGGMISTIAGTSNQCFCAYSSSSNGNNGPATSAKLSSIRSLVVDASSNLYVAGSNDYSVRKINLATGIITAFAGTGKYGDTGDGGPAASAGLQFISGLAVDKIGSLYIADGKLRMVNLAGIISTITTGVGTGYSGDGGPISNALIYATGVAIYSTGNVYFSDASARRVRKMYHALADQAPAATPQVSLAGGSYATNTAVTLSDTTPGPQILYILDGTAPNPGTSPLYAGPLTLIGTVKLQAIAIAPGYSTSGTVTQTYTIGATQAAATLLSLASGTYRPAQTVGVTDTTAGATIYYTTNGTVPTSASTRYTFPIAISTPAWLQAIAVASGYGASPVASATYAIVPLVVPVIQSVSRLQATQTQTITISGTGFGTHPAFSGNSNYLLEVDATARWGAGKGADAINLNVTSWTSTQIGLSGFTGSYGTGSWTLQTGDNVTFDIWNANQNTGPGQCVNIVVGAVATTCAPVTVAAPVFFPPGGTYAATQQVQLTAAGSGVRVLYTTDGTTPDVQTSSQYSGPIPVSASGTLQAIAVSANYAQSALVSSKYVIMPVLSLIQTKRCLEASACGLSLSHGGTIKIGLP